MFPVHFSVDCAAFERFWSFLEWMLKQKSGINETIHYLGNFLFTESLGLGHCADLLHAFLDLAAEPGIP